MAQSVGAGDKTQSSNSQTVADILITEAADATISPSLQIALENEFIYAVRRFYDHLVNSLTK